MNNLPTLQELFFDVELEAQKDALLIILNQNPPDSWVMKHPQIANHKYLPIDKVEYLLSKIFKTYKIEVLKTGMLLNAIEVTVRVHYKHPVTGEMLYHDGVAAQEIQTKAGSGSLNLDMSNINRGAVTMALPIAKTLAIKDACDHFGAIFGANLNRKNAKNYEGDALLHVKRIGQDATVENFKEFEAADFFKATEILKKVKFSEDMTESVMAKFKEAVNNCKSEADLQRFFSVTLNGEMVKILNDKKASFNG